MLNFGNRCIGKRLLILPVLLLLSSWPTGAFADVGGPTNGVPPIIRPNARQEIYLIRGKRQELRCPVLSETKLLVEWYKNGKLVGPGWMKLRVTQDGILKIKNVQPEDSGQYQCKANNGFGTVHFTYNVDVQDEHEYDELHFYRKDSPPRWTNPAYIQKLSNTAIVQPAGSDFTLKCSTKGYPLPDIVWTKDGKVIKEAWGGKFGLTLNKLKSSDTGTYQCKVTNIFGSRNATFKVVVTGQGNASPQLEFHEHPHASNGTINEGQTATFYCKVRSSVEPNIKWLRQIDSPYQRIANATMISADGHNYTMLDSYPSKTVKRPNGTWVNQLTLPFVTQRHTGWYVCVVTNPAGHMIFRKALLRVIQTKWNAPEKLPLHIIVGIPVAAVLLAAVAYAIYFLKKNQQKGNNLKPGHNISSLSIQRPPLPNNPPPTIPPPSSSAKIYRSDQYKMYHQLDPQAAMPLNSSFGAPSNSLERDLYETTPQPYELRYNPEGCCRHDDLTDSLSDLASPNRIQHYPSLYSCT